MATIATVLFFDDIQAEKKQFVMPLVGGQIDINTSVMTYQYEKNIRHRCSGNDKRKVKIILFPSITV